MKPRLAPPTRGAFTLIELLVVIAIIAVLASLLLPALSRAKTTAWVTKCQGNEKQMGLALAMYVPDFGGYPYGGYTTKSNPKMVSYWYDVLAPYLGNAQWGKGVLQCPAYKWKVYSGRGVPERSEFDFAMGPYAYNVLGRPPVAGISSRALGLGDVSPATSIPVAPLVKESDIKAPSRMYAIGDTKILETWINGWSGGEFIYIEPFPESKITDKLAHPKGYNMLFADGHVENVKPAALLASDAESRRRWSREN